MSMVKSLYIVSKTGQPLYFFDFEKMGQQIIEDATLFSGMISAIRGFLNEMSIGEVSSFDTDKNRVYIRPIEDLAYVLIVDKSSNFSESMIQTLLKEFTTKIVIETNHETTVFITKQENQLLNQMIMMIYNSWQDANKESQAAKKVQDELW